MFNYEQAFSRNIGWVTQEQQQSLRHKRVAIAGAGGVGGEHLLTLTRMGVGKFNIADFDTFEIHNFNRQAGATMTTLEQPKSDVMLAMCQDINPEAQVNNFASGIDENNVDAFLQDVDIYVDSLDFFALQARKIVFQKCQERRIPIVTAAPLGMGCAFLAFLPGKMTFEQYFRFNDVVTDDATESLNRQYIQFLIGLSPSMLQLPYLAVPDAADFHARKGPSTPMAVKLCAGIAATNAVKILLGKGKVLAAPWGLHFDAYRNKLSKTWRPLGNRNPLQKLVYKLATSKLLYKYQHFEPAAELPPIKKLVEYAKWAATGDNTQPFRFEFLDEQRCIVHGYDTRDEVVYDKQGNASKLAIGCMIANGKIAAGNLGYKLQVSAVANRKGYAPDQPEYERYPTFLFELQQDNHACRHPLQDVIFKRTVQRKSMGSQALTASEKQTLEACLPAGYSIIWQESNQAKKQMAKFIFASGFTRLNMPEAFNVHAQVIENRPYDKDKSAEKNCNAIFSKDKIPAQATGMDPFAIIISKFVLSNWKSYQFIHKYLKGTLLPRLQLDYIPSLRCSGHFLLLAEKEANTWQDYVKAGEVVQTFWLTATKLNLCFQPQYTPIVFSELLRRNISFSADQTTLQHARKVEQSFHHLFAEENVIKAIFMGRVGRGTPPTSRSVRLSLSELSYQAETGDVPVDIARTVDF